MEEEDVVEASSEPEPVLSEKIQIDVIFDPWDDNRTRKLFLPVENEHPMDAIVRRIDVLLEAWMTPDGYKLILDGGDPLNNATELDKIIILEKSMYLIAALKNALNYYPRKHGQNAVKMPAMPVAFLQHPTKKDKCKDGGAFLKLKTHSHIQEEKRL